MQLIRKERFPYSSGAASRHLAPSYGGPRSLVSLTSLPPPPWSAAAAVKQVPLYPFLLIMQVIVFTETREPPGVVPVQVKGKRKTSPRAILSRVSFSRVARNNYHNSVTLVRFKWPPLSPSSSAARFSADRPLGEKYETG